MLTILKGITILAASTSDNVDHMTPEEAYRVKQTTTIELSEVKIAHAREFFINKKGESVDTNKTEAKPKGKVIGGSKQSEYVHHSRTTSKEASLLDSESSSSEDDMIQHSSTRTTSY